MTESLTTFCHPERSASWRRVEGSLGNKRSCFLAFLKLKSYNLLSHAAAKYIHPTLKMIAERKRTHTDNLLRLFRENPGRLIPYSELTQKLDFPPDHNAILAFQTHVTGLRKEHNLQLFIIRGLGYVNCPDSDSPSKFSQVGASIFDPSPDPNMRVVAGVSSLPEAASQNEDLKPLFPLFEGLTNTRNEGKENYCLKPIVAGKEREVLACLAARVDRICFLEETVRVVFGFSQNPPLDEEKLRCAVSQIRGKLGKYQTGFRVYRIGHFGPQPKTLGHMLCNPLPDGLVSLPDLCPGFNNKNPIMAEATRAFDLGRVGKNDNIIPVLTGNQREALIVLEKAAFCGHPLSTQHLAEAIWPEDPRGIASTKVVVNKLRRALEEASPCLIVEGTRNFGYSLTLSESKPQDRK